MIISSIVSITEELIRSVNHEVRNTGGEPKALKMVLEHIKVYSVHASDSLGSAI